MDWQLQAWLASELGAYQKKKWGLRDLATLGTTEDKNITIHRLANTNKPFTANNGKFAIDDAVYFSLL